MSDPYIGEIRMVGFTFAPQGWLDCNGAILSISQYETLYALIGTTYGGDGQNNFALPDLRSRTLLNQGAGGGLPNYALGQQVGQENVTLNGNTLAMHNHPFSGSNDPGNQAGPGGSYPATLQSGEFYTSDTSSPLAMASNATLPFGGNQPHNNLMPTNCLRFIIATEGIYPSQS